MQKQENIFSRWNLSLTENSSRSNCSPPGFSLERNFHSEENQGKKSRESIAELKLKVAWDVAKSPSSSILMTLFMSWMAGSSVNIFSIMITLYSFLNSLKAIFGVNSVFAKYADDSIKSSLWGPKLTYIGINCITLSIALYKGWVLGLLPLTAADWIAYLSIKQSAEFSSGFIIN